MATWAKCPDLFLYTKGKDVYLWRCNETTWMPMNTADFDDLGKVMDHVDLIGGKDSLLEWEKSSYIDLVAYISSRRLLVNSRGLVIAELHEFDQDGKVEENGLPIYIRSLDVLSLKPFGLRDRSIPSRTVRYLETEGKAVPVEDSTTTTTTTTSSSTELDEGKRRADLEKQVEELKAANKTLKSDKEAAEKQANDLKDRNKSLADDVTAQKTAAEKAQQERDAAKRDKEAAERKAAVAEKEATELKETNKTLKSGKEAAEKKITKLKETNKTLDKQVKDLQDQIKSLTPKEPVWMNDLNIPEDNNMGFVSLDELDWNNNHDMALHGSQGSFTTEDDTTNVRASYFFKLASAYLNEVYTWIGIDFDSLPKREMARFIPTYWSVGYHNGYPYVVKLISRHKVATGEITFSLVP